MYFTNDILLILITQVSQAMTPAVVIRPRPSATPSILEGESVTASPESRQRPSTAQPTPPLRLEGAGGVELLAKVELIIYFKYGS